jgi:adenosine deaminase CECR1
MRPLRPVILLLATVAVLRAAGFEGRFEELKARATPAQLYALLYDLPKGGDIHNHAYGSHRPEWMYAVLTDPARNGGDRFYTRIRFASPPEAIEPSMRFRTIRRHTHEKLAPATRAEYVPLESLTAAERAEWCNAFRLDQPGEGRREFFEVIWTRFGDTGRNPHVRYELLVDNIKAFAAEGLAYLETQTSARGMFDNEGRPISDADGAAFVRARLAAPDVAATGLVVRLQEAVLRFTPVAEQDLRETYEFVAANRDLWVGLNMVGIEESGKGYPARFLDTFRDLRRRHPTLPLSIHAGEMDGPNSHIRDTLLLGASRIGHGVNLLKDPDTLLLLQQSRRTLIEVNLISNRLLEYVPDLSVHHFPELLRTGVPVCLNTDDRGMWDSNMTDEYFTAVTLFNLSWPEVVALGRNSLAYAFVEEPVKSRLLAAYAERVAAFEARYGAGSLDQALARLAAVRPVTYGYAQRTWGLEFTP